jgi:hypothetical protein
MRSGSFRSPDTLASIESAPPTDPTAGRLSWALSSTTRATPNGTEREPSPSARKALSISAASAPLCLQSVDLSAGSPTTWSTENRGPRATGSPARERVSSSSSAMGTAIGVPEALSKESATTTVPGLRSGASAPAKPPSRAASMGTVESIAIQRRAASGPTPVRIRTNVGPVGVGRDPGKLSRTVQPGTRTRPTSRGMA